MSKKDVLTESMYHALRVFTRIGLEDSGRNWHTISYLTHKGANPASVLALVKRGYVQESPDTSARYPRNKYKLNEDAYFYVRQDLGVPLQ